MFTYLGEDKSEFEILVEQSINNNEIERFSIVNERGSFKAYKAVLNKEEGYAYLSNGDFYEFASNDKCNILSSEKVKIADKYIMQFGKIEKSFLKQRNDETKEIDNHKIEVTTSNLLPKTVIATKATFEDKKGFIYKEKTKGNFFNSVDIIVNIFVEESQVKDLGKVSSSLLLTQKEKVEIDNQDKKRLYEERLNFLKKLDIIVTDSKIGDFKFDMTVGLIKKEKLNKEEMKGTYTIDELILKSKKVREAKIEEKLNDELMKYGISIKVNDIVKDDKIELSIHNKKGKEISKLSLDSVLYKSCDFKVRTLDEYETINFDVIVIDFESNIDKLKIIENGKSISLKNSKFKDFYKIIEDEAFVVDLHSDLFCHEYIDLENGNSVAINNFDITNKTEIKKLFIREIDCDSKIQKSLKSDFEVKGNTFKK